MRTERYFTSTLVALACAVLATFFLIACQQSQPPAQAPPAQAPTSMAQSKAASTEKVFVVFEGPWAFVPDPSNDTKFLALAPKTKSHRDLYVASSNSSTLASGVYDLSVPVSGELGAATLDPNLVQAKTTAAIVQRVLNTKLERYAIRVPKPEAFVAATRYRSRVGPSYPPDPSTEKDYVTAVSLRYTVSSLSGFSLAGSPDTGSFNPLLLQVDTPTVHFAIEPDPAHEDNPADKCRLHSREAFRDSTKLLNVHLYVDFPESPSSCHDKDPQRSTTAQGVRPSALEKLVALDGNLAGAQTASVNSEMDVRRLLAAFHFFGRPVGGCMAPILMLTLE